MEMGNDTEEGPPTPPGPSASSTGSVQLSRALPQPPLRVTISRLPVGLGLAREQMRQVEGERGDREPFSAQPQLSVLRGLWKFGGQLGGGCVGSMKEEGMCWGNGKLSPPDSLSLG